MNANTRGLWGSGSTGEEIALKVARGALKAEAFRLRHAVPPTNFREETYSPECVEGVFSKVRLHDIGWIAAQRPPFQSES